MAESPAHEADLLIRLAHELAIALDMHFMNGTELQENFPQAIGALFETRDRLMELGLPTPPPVQHVLNMLPPPFAG